MSEFIPEPIAQPFEKARKHPSSRLKNRAVDKSQERDPTQKQPSVYLQPTFAQAPAFASLRVEINTADRAYRQLKDLISVDVEELWVIALDPKKTLIDKRMVFRGTVDSCLVHPRDIFRFAYTSNASSVIVSHSHPSGDLLPSEQDLLFTQELIRASRILQLPVVDHLIITPFGYSSFANEGWCRFSSK